MSTQRLPVKLLDDLPATDDAFGTHERIAAAVLDMILTDTGGRAVALAGDWGSGKSTVVKLLQLAADHRTGAKKVDVEVFIFDAWAHEGDPLRRSFLERLIAALQAKHWIGTEKWEKKLDELRKRRKKTDTTSSPIFSRAGIAMLLLLYSIPLAVALLASSHSFWHKYLVLTAALLMYCLPPLFALCRWLWHRSSEETSSFNLLGMLFNRTVERTTTDAFETPEPTSVEFQNTFREVSADALGTEAGKERRIVIVLDNLDRLETSAALELWSAISTFVEVPSASSHSWAQRVWTLVPFDERSIRRLWDKGEHGKIGEAFLAKTFQIRFNVPTPLLSDWSAFLEKQLRAAFPEHNEREFYGISRIFSTLCVETVPPNARDIKNFVNQIGTTYRAQPDDIPLSVHALLAALTHKGREWKPADPIPSRDELLSYLGGEPETELAALYFNVPRDKALQAIFGPRVENFLAQGDAEQLSALLEKPGLDYVVFEAIQQNLPKYRKSEPFRIGRAAYACRKARDAQSYLWEEVWKRIEHSATLIPDLTKIDQRSGAGFALLVKRQCAADFAQKLLRSISASQLPLAQPEAKSWLDGASQILRAIVECGQQDAIREHFKIGMNPENYVGFFGQLLPPELIATADVIRSFQPLPGAPAIVEHLSSLVSGTGFANSENAFRNLTEIAGDWQWLPLVTSALNKLQQVNAQPNELGPIIRALLRLSKQDEQARNGLNSITQSGWLFHHLWVSQSAGVPSSIASCILAIMIYQPEANYPSSPASAAQGRNQYRNYMSNIKQSAEVFNALVEQAAELVSARKLIDMSSAANLTKAALREVLRALAARPEASGIFNAELCLDHHSLLRSELGEDVFGALLTSHLKSNQLKEVLLSRPFAVDLIGVYEIALRTGGAALTQHIVEGLRDMPRDEWSRAMREDSQLVQMVLELHSTNAPLALSINFTDAMLETIDRALGGTKPALEPKTCEMLLNVLDDDQRQTLEWHVAGEIADARSSLSVLLLYFEYMVRDCNLLEEVAEELIREGIPRMLTRLNEAELDWVDGAVTRCPGIAKKCTPSSLSALRTRITEKLKEELAPSIRNRLEGIAGALATGASRKAKKSPSDPVK